MKKTILLTTLFAALITTSCSKKTQQPKPEQTCANVKAVTPAGRLAVTSTGDQYLYTTSGGGQVKIDYKTNVITFTHKDYPVFFIEMWGELDVNGKKMNAANHENIKGKHIKDRMGTVRTVIFPDGAKVTMTSRGERDLLLTVNIYDGNQSHRISNECSRSTYSAVSSAAQVQQLDDQEADGEASTFEITSAGLLWVNIYQEDTPGNKINKRTPLGQLYRDQPNRVDDLFDDPRLGNT